MTRHDSKCNQQASAINIYAHGITSTRQQNPTNDDTKIFISLNSYNPLYHPNPNVIKTKHSLKRVLDSPPCHMRVYTRWSYLIFLGSSRIYSIWWWWWWRVRGDGRVFRARVVVKQTKGVTRLVLVVAVWCYGGQWWCS